MNPPDCYAERAESLLEFAHTPEELQRAQVWALLSLVHQLTLIRSVMGANVMVQR